jgi:hypothetical protein
MVSLSLYSSVISYVCVCFLVAARRALAFQTATVGASSSAALSLLPIDRNARITVRVFVFLSGWRGPVLGRIRECAGSHQNLHSQFLARLRHSRITHRALDVTSTSPTRPSLRVSPASVSIGFALVHWKGVKWNQTLDVIRLVFKRPQVRASSSDLVTSVTMEFVLDLT